ncbi:fungal-specific transcription factor domain-containing protein [Phyllosticta citriasiana]|uniref:fungal-specific transcription factor domain-containing protein n=1 Tax=Phyllosticta citriasiana TaxID=595635 RepID=UPI0030FD6BF1
MDSDSRMLSREITTQSRGPSTDESQLAAAAKAAKVRPRNKRKDGMDDQAKRRCVSTACIACRRRKSKCDGNTPACAACASVYNTDCVYDPGSDHRRKGVYKKDIDQLRTKNSTLETLIQAILNYPEDEVPGLVRQIRTCESLDMVAEQILMKEQGLPNVDEEISPFSDSPPGAQPTFETQLSGKMGHLRLEDGSQRYIGGTSNLIYLNQGADDSDNELSASMVDQYAQQEDPITSWTRVTMDRELVMHLINMYFVWHYSFFTTLTKNLFYRDFLLGNPPGENGRKYCTPLLVNAMLALGCHFTSLPGARANREDSATAGDHFFKEAKRIIMENDEHEKPRMTTVQALALMSVREAGCGREAKGWVYSGMSFRMACDLGLNLDSGGLSSGQRSLDDDEEDARRVTFWGCFLFDKCWSNYLGRLPQLPTSLITVPKFEVFPNEDSEIWCAYTDSGFSQANAQPARTRAVARQISALCEISNDLMNAFYNPSDMDKAKGKQAELKKLSELHQRLEAWRRDLPKELEPKEGGLPSMLVMHMFFQLLYIHLFRPFLKYNQQSSPLPPNVSPRKLCTQAAQSVSKLLRLYKRSHGLRQICNVAVYITHSACTIHLLNLPEKNARRDIIHGLKHLEEIAEGWLCARRTLGILSILVHKWKVELPEEAAAVLTRTDSKFGSYSENISRKSLSPPTQPAQPKPVAAPQNLATYGYLDATRFPATSANGVFGSSTVTSAFESLTQDTERSRTGPPQTAAEIQYTRPGGVQHAHVHTPQQNPATPASTTINTSNHQQQQQAGGSPCDLFGGVDALLRESQDNWWLRDQSALALGFDNWGVGRAGSGGTEDAYLGASGSGASGNLNPTSTTTTAGPFGAGLNGLSAGERATGAGVGTDGNVNASTAPSATGPSGIPDFGGLRFGLTNLYNEEEWYR